MIARLWRGKTLEKNADNYYNYLLETGLKEYRNTEGNRGVIALRSIVDDTVEFTLISFWESYEAIMKFSGENIEKAVFYPRDDEFLIEKDLKVFHYDVLSFETR